MATTPNLLITHIETNQSQKEVTANEGLESSRMSLLRMRTTLW
jgi:hypothetical protein